MLEKFPVSKDGVDYMITIKQHHLFKDVWITTLYIKQKYKLFKLFNFTYNKELWNEGFTLEDLNIYWQIEKLDFIYMANRTIELYEKNLEKKKIYNDTFNNAKKDFYNWDGKC